MFINIKRQEKLSITSIRTNVSNMRISVKRSEEKNK